MQESAIKKSCFIKTFCKYNNPRSNRKKYSHKQIIKDIRNLFKKDTKDNGIKHRILRDIRTLFESDEKGYYKPIRIGKVFSNN